MSRFLIGDMRSSFTPLGLRATKEASLHLGYYLKNYRGGRNESFMYGYDNERDWYDYDLVSAYTTGMAWLGDPDYDNAFEVSGEELLKMKDEKVILSYTIIKAKFSFNDDVKFPSIPVSVDETTTVYPLKGDCILTSSEYILAKNQGCELDIKHVYRIPFKGESGLNSKYDMSKGEKGFKPYFGIMEEIQRERRRHPDGSFMNLLYKLLGNAAYGIVCKGLGDSKRFSIETQRAERTKSSDLTNPFMGSWITGFIRSVIGELMHNTWLIKGKIVSCMTDGFITNVKDLKNKILKSELEEIKNNRILLKIYNNIKKKLCDDPAALKLKHENVTGLISWARRDQFSLDRKIAARTVLERRGFEQEILKEKMLSIMEL